MKKNLFISLVIFMVASILSIVVLQGYWIYSAWEDKEEEFSLAVQQSLQLAADEIQERELSDYIQAYENLIDSLDSPDNASFANVFLFLDEDKPNNLNFGMLVLKTNKHLQLHTWFWVEKILSILDFGF